MDLKLKMIGQMVDAFAQTLTPQKSVVKGNYLAKHEAMRRWQKKVAEEGGRISYMKIAIGPSGIG